MNKIKIVILNDDATIPSKTDSRCAGYDLCSNNNYFIKKGSRELISTGISVEILEYYYLRIAPRSELSTCGIDVGEWVIDSSHSGELKVLIINNSGVPYEIQKGDKSAQLIINSIIP